MQLRSLGRIFEVAVDMIGFVPVAYRGTPDEMAYLDALKVERPAWVTPYLGYRKAIMNASRAAGHSVFSYKPDCADSYALRCSAAPSKGIIHLTREYSCHLPILSVVRRE